MKQINLNVANRETVGGKSAARYRKEGKIPAVIYGESGCKNLLVDAKEFSVVAKSVLGKAALLEIHFEDGTESRYAILKEVLRDPLKDNVEHIDFKEVVRGKPMDAVIPLHFEGEAEGVKNENGVLEINLHEVPVRCRPRDLPEFIVVDVSNLHVGESITVSGLKLPEGVEIHGAHADAPVVSCSSVEVQEEEPAAAEAESAEGAAAAPAAKE